MDKTWCQKLMTLHDFNSQGGNPVLKFIFPHLSWECVWIYDTFPPYSFCHALTLVTSPRLRLWQPFIMPKHNFHDYIHTTTQTNKPHCLCHFDISDYKNGINNMFNSILFDPHAAKTFILDYIFPNIIFIISVLNVQCLQLVVKIITWIGNQTLCFINFKSFF